MIRRIFTLRMHLTIDFLYMGIMALSLWSAFALRFDFPIPSDQLVLYYWALAVALPVKMFVFYQTRRPLRQCWGYFGAVDLLPLLGANVLGTLAFAIILYGLIGPEFPRSVYCLDLLICFVYTAGAQFSARMVREGWLAPRPEKDTKGLLIYGAGVAGISLAREIRANRGLGYTVLGFLDDAAEKKGAALMGLPVLGTGEGAPAIVNSLKNARPPVAEIVITIPSATSRELRMAVERCRPAGVPCRVVPGLGELIRGKVPGQMHEVCVNDLLGRDPVHLDVATVHSAVAGKSILVTGAAGSIGSELCRQLAELQPAALVAFDQAESDLFKLDWELRAKMPALKLYPEIGDVRDARRVQEVIRCYSVDSLFHAAAYKHVPLMEKQVIEAVRNNVIGTWNVAQAAFQNRVPNFLLISTDKAVNPTSIMGLTKRIAEILISDMPSGADGGGTKFVAVRFGNVLVSNGSVVPLFQKQIAAGGPVTITHPDIRRYFMTAQEAVALVLQASTMGNGSEIYVLDMGKPVRIVDLARNMIRLAGFIPEEEIEIRYIGLRPGEKILEELTFAGEHIKSTYHEKIKIFQGPVTKLSAVRAWMEQLRELVAAGDAAPVLAHMAALVPEYRPFTEEFQERRQVASPVSRPAGTDRRILQTGSAAASA